MERDHRYRLPTTQPTLSTPEMMVMSSVSNWSFNWSWVGSLTIRLRRIRTVNPQCTDAALIFSSSPPSTSPHCSHSRDSFTSSHPSKLMSSQLPSVLKCTTSTVLMRLLIPTKKMLCAGLSISLSTRSTYSLNSSWECKTATKFLSTASMTGISGRVRMPFGLTSVLNRLRLRLPSTKELLDHMRLLSLEMPTKTSSVLVTPIHPFAHQEQPTHFLEDICQQLWATLSTITCSATLQIKSREEPATLPSSRTETLKVNHPSLHYVII